MLSNDKQVNFSCLHVATLPHVTQACTSGEGLLRQKCITYEGELHFDVSSITMHTFQLILLSVESARIQRDTDVRGKSTLKALNLGLAFAESLFDCTQLLY